MPILMLVIVAGLVFGSIAVPTAVAQSRSEWEEDEEGSRYRGISSSVQRKINALDDDEVDDLPVPILFGITVASLWPNFGDPRGGGTREHEGLDIMAPEGAYIISPTEAVVTRVGKGTSAGNYVYTANPGGETFRYMHLDEIADGVRAGVELKVGDLIGYVGNTGNASGGPAHLHFELETDVAQLIRSHALPKTSPWKDRIQSLEAIIEDADDEEEEAERAISLYRSSLIAARAQGIELPDEITEELGTVSATSAVRDLTLGSAGDDVTALQSFLITKESGAQAEALAKAGATGYFGPLTQRALAEYQEEIGIAPASGYYGPLTRARVAEDN